MNWRTTFMAAAAVCGLGAVAYWLAPRSAYDLNIGHEFAQREMYEEAIPHFIRAVELNESPALAHNNLGLCYVNTGRTDEAIAEFSKAIELDPARPHYAFNLATALVSVEQYGKALDAAKRARQNAYMTGERDIIAKCDALIANAEAKNHQQ